MNRVFTSAPGDRFPILSLDEENSSPFSRTAQEIEELITSKESGNLLKGLALCHKHLRQEFTAIHIILAARFVTSNNEDREEILKFSRELGELDPCKSVFFLGEFSSEPSDIDLVLSRIRFDAPEGNSENILTDAVLAAQRIDNRIGQFCLVTQTIDLVASSLEMMAVTIRQGPSACNQPTPAQNNRRLGQILKKWISVRYWDS